MIFHSWSLIFRKTLRISDFTYIMIQCTGTNQRHVRMDRASRRIGKVLGPETLLLHGGKGTARETKRRLSNAGLLNEGTGAVQIISSDPAPKAVELAWKLLNG